MDTQNYNKLKPLILTIKKYLITPKRKWWTLGLLKRRVKHYKEIQKILNSLESYQPESTSTFKYVVNLLYDCDAFKKTKAIRESLLEFINNYVVKNSYEREDIARFLYMYAPRYRKLWWTAWQIKVPALIAHEESVLHKFRNRYNNSSSNKPISCDNHVGSSNKNISENPRSKILTDSKILKIADDISNLSQTIYTELPKIDQKIKFEIKRISDDLKGLANLIDMLDSEVPFNVQNIKKEIKDILISFNTVIVESSSILEKKLSINHAVDAGEKNNTTSNPKVQNNILSDTNTIDSKNDKEQNKPKIKTIIADDIKWEDNKVSNITDSKKTTRPSEIKSYVNRELTKQLHTHKLFKNKYRNTENLNHNINNRYINAVLSEDNTSQNKNKKIINITQKTTIENNSNDNTGNLTEPLYTHGMCNDSKNKNAEPNFNDVYTVNFSDPNNIYNKIMVSLDLNKKTLSLNDEIFKIDSQNGLNKLQNYLDSSREEMQAISLSDIVMKFMYDTPLNLEQLEEYGLKAG